MIFFLFSLLSFSNPSVVTTTSVSSSTEAVYRDGYLAITDLTAELLRQPMPGQEGLSLLWCGTEQERSIDLDEERLGNSILDGLAKNNRIRLAADQDLRFLDAELGLEAMDALDLGQRVELAQIMGASHLLEARVVTVPNPGETVYRLELRLVDAQDGSVVWRGMKTVLPARDSRIM